MGAEGLEDASKVHETPRNVANEREVAPSADAVRDGSDGCP
ncbi:MAG: hypothetical protein QOI41_379, partial [Myxococcales bacterium]|nr:hypothetical protein [Myxococcales bacterium]